MNNSQNSIDNIKPDFKGILIYPNPTSSRIHIENLHSKKTRLNMYSADGQKMLSKNTSSNMATLEVDFLQSGLYLLEILSNGNPKYFKIIKK